MLETRLIPLGLLLLRLIAGAFALQPTNNALAPLTVAVVVKAVIGLWIFLSFITFLLDRPRSESGYHLIAVADLLFSILLLVSHTPFAALPLLAIHCLGWYDQGGRIPLHPVLPVYILLWIFAWSLSPFHVTSFFRFHPSFLDMVRMILLLAAASATVLLFTRRQAGFAALDAAEDDDHPNNLNLPFGYDFSTWSNSVVRLYGRSAICLIGVRLRQGQLSVYANNRIHVAHGSFDKFLRQQSDRLPSSLTTIDMRGAMAPLHAGLEAMLPYSNTTLAARQFMIAGQQGMMILGVDLPDDSVLRHEFRRLDQIFEQRVRRASNEIEMRRTFVAEAREVARRDLHDGVLQSLAAIRMRLSTILQNPAIIDDDCRQDIRTTAHIISLEQSRLRLLLESSTNDDDALNLVEVLTGCGKRRLP